MWGIRRWMGVGSSLSRGGCLRFKSEFPDLATSIEVHEHKLTRPQPKLSAQQRQDLRLKSQGSLIPETLEAMTADQDFQRAAADLKRFGQAGLTKEERKKRQRALDHLGIPDFNSFIQDKTGIASLNRLKTEVLQMNIGIYCNQACSHCHVESSPKRLEMMNLATAHKCVELFQDSQHIHTVDITGGAPELCQAFRPLVTDLRKASDTVTIIDRCNLTALLEPVGLLALLLVCSWPSRLAVNGAAAGFRQIAGMKSEHSPYYDSSEDPEGLKEFQQELNQAIISKLFEIMSQPPKANPYRTSRDLSHHEEPIPRPHHVLKDRFGGSPVFRRYLSEDK
eukprot:maker-scaffold13_size735724-snap-gene-6.26 protein:Tk03472 transcript:maker-scaffold13_size735724-snap-gene-6.26-mRNA-1 annotation:"PREDICTED: uncharacterized protein LOC100373547"